MGNNDKKDEKNSSNPKQESSGSFNDDSQKIKDLEAQIAAQNNELKETKEKLEQSKTRNSDDIAPGILNQGTFSGNYRNGYEDGTVKEFEKNYQAEQSRKMHVQS